MNEPRPYRAELARAAGYVVRHARPEDADALARVHVQVWRDTYTGVMRQEVLDRLDPVESGKRWREFLARTDQDRTVWVGVTPGGEVVAMGSAGPARDEDAPTPHELRAINLTRGAQGTGLADLMMGDLVGGRAAYLWVVEGNERAIAFYRRHGFEPLDARWDEDYGVHEVRMVRGAQDGPLAGPRT